MPNDANNVITLVPNGQSPVVREENLPSVPDQESIQTDFEFARKNVRDLITSGSGALDELMSLTSQAQHPKFYEQLTSLFTALVDANERLLTLQQKKKGLSATQNSGEQSTTNNNLILTTADLQKMLELTQTDK